MTDVPDEVQPPLRPRRRRTVLVTSRWAASAAVIAAMTSGLGGALDVNEDDHGPSETSTSADAGGVTDQGSDSAQD
ncbi:hypothetical protein F0U44_20945 [Nocardioides humilatus]|uniref:Uncharacterized protein n=1 Tax=Nocardioides humilatus TaxID=2607660 RepID=A0A5B1L5L7_9ACTN|nr:hypothetical protein [Nocardioides humilatus]KAA1415458.1 hypothetical protein F0U44_20945 [Nocardioides humilatus]